MSESDLRIEVDKGTAVSARRYLPQVASGTILLYAPGAGSNIDDAFGVYLGRELARNGIETWLFQFPYMETRRRAPDRAPVLEATWNAAIAQARASGPKLLVIGGRSMGGRIASRVVAQGAPVDGLVLFAYPLVPPGRDGAARAEHLPDIAVPTLFCSGTRDSFGTPDQLLDASKLVTNSRLHLLDGADHGFATLKSSGRSRGDVFAEATAAALGFIRELAR